MEKEQTRWPTAYTVVEVDGLRLCLAPGYSTMANRRPMTSALRPKRPPYIPRMILMENYDSLIYPEHTLYPMYCDGFWEDAWGRKFPRTWEYRHTCGGLCWDLQSQPYCPRHRYFLHRMPPEYVSEVEARLQKL